MPYRKTTFLKGMYYHIYNRGANKQPIFLMAENYRFLLHRLKKYFQRDNIRMIAYCLMPNHYHFLLRQDSDVSIADTIQAVFNSYTKAFNHMYNHSGTLFEGRFKSILVEKEEYLLHLCRYIHRNPIDGVKPLVQHISDWEYSNYPEWIGIRNGTLIDPEFIETAFSGIGSYEEFVKEYKAEEKIKKELKSYFLE